MTMRTALIRDNNNNFRVFRYDDYNTNKDMEEDLRGNGFRVLKVWKGNKTDAEVDYWELLNRK